MKVTTEKNDKVANMIFASIYPLYLNRLEKNGRTKEEFHQVLEWFTGYNESQLQNIIKEKATFKPFFLNAKIHPNAYMIKGLVCGYRIEEKGIHLFDEKLRLDHTAIMGLPILDLLSKFREIQ